MSNPPKAFSIPKKAWFFIYVKSKWCCGLKNEGGKKSGSNTHTMEIMTYHGSLGRSILVYQDNGGPQHKVWKV